MISVKIILQIHDSLINKFGGSMGLRDLNGLESAIARPFHTFEGASFYPDIFSKAAAIGESIIMNHPFIDGNKRTGYVLMEAVLRFGNYKISASDSELYNFVISISTGERSFDEIVKWLRDNAIEL